MNLKKPKFLLIPIDGSIEIKELKIRYIYNINKRTMILFFKKVKSFEIYK